MKKVYFAFAAALMCAALHAQTPQSTYLLENYVYGYRFNPAYVPEKSFVAVPVVGNLNPSARSQVGLSNLIFPTADGLVTGLNPQVTSEQFLGGLKTLNSANVDLNENIIAFGFRGKRGGYTSVELNLRASVTAALPYTMFSFLKDGDAPSYDMSPTYVSGTAFGELAIGYSRKVNDKLNVGARLKALVGMANLYFDIDKADVSINGDAIRVNADATAYGACNFLRVATIPSNIRPGEVDVMDFDDFGFGGGNFAPSGYGAAIDLGMIYHLTKNLELSFSINDLGLMSWKNNIIGRTDASVTYTGQRFYPEDEDPDDSEARNEYKAAVHTLESLAEFKYDSEESSTQLKLMPFTANFGLKYRMPFYRNLSVGAMGTYKAAHKASWYDMRAGLAITPIEWFSLTGNVGMTTFGPAWGAGLSISFVGINIFVASDGYIGKIAKYKGEKGPAFLYPIDKFGYDINFGLNIIFGKRLRAY
ncbi:MAG: DUF5723 family protein [Bacteroidales bacterium]|nr:DUF5723 family protein [Bacteroidales bacterium]